MGIVDSKRIIKRKLEACSMTGKSSSWKNHLLPTLNHLQCCARPCLSFLHVSSQDCMADVTQSGSCSEVRLAISMGAFV